MSGQPIGRESLLQPRSRLAGAAAGARGIRRGCSLANSAGTYEFAREHPATSRAPAVDAVRAHDLVAGSDAHRKLSLPGIGT